MKIETKFETTAEITSSGGVRIMCFPNYNDQGEAKKPLIYSAKLLEDVTVVNNVRGNQGELFILHNGNMDAVLDEDGNLIIAGVEDEEVQKYFIKEQNLHYGE